MGYRLTLDENRKIEFFSATVEQLEETRLLKAAPMLEIGLRLTFSGQDGTVTAARRELDEDDLRAALTIIRQFRLSEEPVFINRICNICMRALKAAEADPVSAPRAMELRAHLERERDRYKSRHKDSSVVLKIGGEAIGPEDAWDIWINGHYFHRDVEKVAALESLTEPERSLARYNFLAFVQDTIVYAVNLRGVLMQALDDGLILRP